MQSVRWLFKQGGALTAALTPLARPPAALSGSGPPPCLPPDRFKHAQEPQEASSGADLPVNGTPGLTQGRPSSGGGSSPAGGSSPRAGSVRSMHSSAHLNEREQLVEGMLQRLQSLAWQRVDVSFKVMCHVMVAVRVSEWA